MEPHKNPSLILSRPSPPLHPYATHQSSNAIYQKPNATQSNINQSSRIQFDRGVSGSSPCGMNAVGVRIGCSLDPKGIYFSGQVVGGKRVTVFDVEDFHIGFENTVNGTSVLADSAVQAFINLAPSHGVLNQHPQATLDCSAKVAAALRESH
jgi:hypothetical protein